MTIRPVPTMPGASTRLPPVKYMIDQVALARPPVAPSNRVPFLRALVHVGQALFGDDWQEAEKSAIDQPPLWPFSLPENTSPDQAATLEAQHAVYSARYEARALINGRLLQAFRGLRQSILDRQVRAFWRKDVPGAAICQMPVEQFLSEDTNLRMRGYIWNHSSRCSQHVFLDAAELMAAFPLAPQVQAPPGIQPSELSKYLKLALHVHSLGFGPTFTGQKKDVQKALVKAAGQFELNLTQRQEEYLATFLRNEEAQGGKNTRSSS